MSLFSFKDVCQDVTKTATKIPTSEYLEEGKYEIFDQGKSFVAGYTNNSIGIANEFPYIVFGDHTRAIKYVDVPCFIGADGVKLLKVNNSNFDSKYVYYTLLNFPIMSQGYSRHFKYLKECVFVERSLEEQNRIVSELDKIQSAIDNKRQQLAKLDELVNSKFYEMFECKNYPISTIGECCTLKSGTTFKKELELESGDYMYIKVSDMNLPENEKYIRTSKTYVSSSSIKNFAIPGNSIIFPKRGGAIATNKKRITQNTICVDLNTMAVTPNSTLNLDYLYQFFVNIDMGKLYNGAAVPQINNKDIAPLKISIPPLELQEQFANFAQKIEQAKDVVSKQINNLQELLDSRMDFYFRQ